MWRKIKIYVFIYTHLWYSGLKQIISSQDTAGINILYIHMIFFGLPSGASGKEPACQCRRCKGQEFDPWVGFIPWVGKIPLKEGRHGNPLQCSRLENPMAWRAKVHRVANGQTQLKRLNTHAHTYYL